MSVLCDIKLTEFYSIFHYILFDNNIYYGIKFIEQEENYLKK